ncbi:unnamed protein product [Leptosia nina]|uniref:Uncharacterized protein n=1 Tax=Leptosia nina TaxID=320188 RepID=A0AAV1K253_9NEOP
MSSAGSTPFDSDRYKKCTFLNAIQHIDIHGRVRSSYIEKGSAVTSVSSYCRCFTNPTVCVNSRLKGFSVTTKVCGLYPGNDILSKKARKQKTDASKRFPFGSVMVR